MDDATIRSYRDLRVWQEAMTLAELCYRETADFPRDEMFGLTAQIRRAAVSIAANVAEGWGRESTKSFVQFLRVSQGSCKELETHLILAQRVLAPAPAGLEAALTHCDAVGKMIRGMIRSLQDKL
jgi:four helix bundle protein